MRLVSLGMAIAFLLTATHVMVDHHAGRDTHFVFLPHVDASHCHSDGQCTGVHHGHDHNGAPAREHDPDHHGADTHSHFDWYTPAGSHTLSQPLLLVRAADVSVTTHLYAGVSALHAKAFVRLPLNIPLYLRCSTLLL